MTTNDQELPIDVPVKKVAANVTKQPEAMTTPNGSLPNFTILASLPWTFGDPMCCTQYHAEIWRGEYDDIFVTYWHGTDCDVWRFVP